MKTSLRKYLSLVMVLCVAFVCLFAVNVKAATELASVDFTTKSASHSAYTDAWKYGEWTVSGGANNSAGWAYVKMGGKSTNLTKYNDIYIASPIVTASATKVNVNVIAGSVAKTGMTATISLEVYSDAELSTKVDTVSAQTVTSAAQAFSFAPSSLTSWPANSYYKVVFNVTNTSTTNGIVWLDGISIEGEANVPTISVSGASNAEIGKQVALTATTQNTTSEVVWDSSDKSVATVANGVVTPLTMGTTTITAKLADDNSVSTSLTITVYPASGEISIAEALEICDFAGGSQTPFDYTVTGEIVTIDYAYSSTNNNISVTISDGINELYLYKLTGGSDLAVGTKVKATGKLSLYNSTYELVYGEYEIVIDDTLAPVIESLNAINAKMSLGYKYTSYSETVVAADGVMKYSGDTTNMVAEENNAALVGLDVDKFTVTSTKKAATVEVGLNKDGSIRLYHDKNEQDGAELGIKTNDDSIIAKIVIEFDTTVNEFTVNGVDGSKEITEYNIDATSVVIKNVSATGQVRIKSISIYLEGSTATKNNYTFENADFRIRCGVDAAIDNIADSYGIRVTANGVSKSYDMTSDFWGEDADYVYATISLGDVLTNSDRLDAKFTVEAYIVVDGATYYSTSSTTYSVIDLVVEYYNNAETKEVVASLYDLLLEMGKIA